MTKFLIFMASGNSSRFGKNKLLQPIQGRPLFSYGLEALQEAARRVPDCKVLVVSRYPEIRAYAEDRGLTAVDAPESQKGASYTVRAAIQSLGSVLPSDYLLFSVADQPLLRPDSICSLLAKADGTTVTARLYCGDRPGNPVLFSASLVPELLALQGDQGGGCVAKRHSCIPVPIQDPGEFRDLDEESDFRQLFP